MTYIQTGAGAALLDPNLAKITTGRREKPGSFLTGPRIIVGPFNWLDDGKEHSWSASQKWFGSVAGRSTQAWIAAKLGQIAVNYKNSCDIAGGAFGPTTGPMTLAQQWRLGLGGKCTRSHKTWGIDKEIPPGAWTGKIPLAKTKHETTGQWWGIFVTFNDNAFTVTWKKIQKTFFQKLWDFIVSVVSFIVDTIQKLYDVFKMVACALAKKYLDEAAAIARKEKKLDAPFEKVLSGFGVEKGDLDKLRKSGDTGLIDDETATAIGNAVVASVCKVPPPLGQPPKTPWLLYGAVGVVGVIGILALLKR